MSYIPLSLTESSAETSEHNPHGYLIGTEIVEANLRAGKYIGGKRRVHGSYEDTLDLILSVETEQGSISPKRLVTASRNYPDSGPPIVRKTTYHLVCMNPNAKTPRTRILRIGGHNEPIIFPQGKEYHDLMSKLKTRDFRDQFARSL